jgi:hypothetical protein
MERFFRLDATLAFATLEVREVRTLDLSSCVNSLSAIPEYRSERKEQDHRPLGSAEYLSSFNEEAIAAISHSLPGGARLEAPSQGLQGLCETCKISPVSTAEVLIL